MIGSTKIAPRNEGVADVLYEMRRATARRREWLLVLTGKKSGEVLETGMTKSQADEMKRNSGF